MSAVLESTADGRDSRQFVTFKIEDETFGVPLVAVREIIRVPVMVHVPLSPPSLEGIANLRGAVLPVTNLRRVFGAAEAAHDDATRIVVLNRGGHASGLIVDRMAHVISAEPEEIEDGAAARATIGSDHLRGVIKREGGMILLLDPDHLHGEATRGPARGSGLTSAVATAERTESSTGSHMDEVHLVSFASDGEEYAFPIDVVQEIVQLPESITRVPRAEPHIFGVMTLRQRLLPLVSLRRIFGSDDRAPDEQSRIMVVSPGGREAPSIGIVMDSVKEVLRVNRGLVEPVPALLAGEGAHEFEAICRLEGGTRLVTILSVARMFGEAVMRAAETATDETTGRGASMAESNAAASMTIEQEEQFVVFRLAGEEYGLPIEDVQEIVRVPEALTRVPKAAGFIEGVVNLRGAVLPVVDQRRRFALPEASRNDRQRIMVLTLAGLRTGFIVDSVSEVLKIARSAIEPAPDLSADQARLIHRVANLERQKRMILLLEPSSLLAASEVGAARDALAEAGQMAAA